MDEVSMEIFEHMTGAFVDMIASFRATNCLPEPDVRPIVRIQQHPMIFQGSIIDTLNGAQKTNLLIMFSKQGHALKNCVEGVSDEAFYPWESPKKNST